MKCILVTAISACMVLSACNNSSPKESEPNRVPSLMHIYAPVKLTTDLTQLTDEEKKILPLLIEAAKIMDGIFWKEAFGNKEELLNKISDEDLKAFALANYGPWNRLDGDTSFIESYGKKPDGAGFYPIDMSKEEFEKWDNELKASPYTIITRNETGQLKANWYHDYFNNEINAACELLKQAAAITTDSSFKFYLDNRIEALLTDSYGPSDIAWLGMKDNALDIILGPIENYEDKLFGIKSAHEAYVLVRDKEWSKKLDHFAALLPDLQTQLPVADAYKQDEVGSNSQLAAFDVVYYAGDCNSGGKTIAVNLPNDEQIQQQFGTRRSQLKNAMRAKYDKILVPLSELLIDESQRKHITFDAFFSNVMFHEVAHGLGIKNVVGDTVTVREALKEEHAALEEAKADVLGLWLVSKLRDMGEISEGTMMDNYVTFVASVFRSCRFGASSAHGKANMLTFNFLKEKGAYERSANGTYMLNAEKMKQAIDDLAAMILKLQGDGAYALVQETMKKSGVVPAELQGDLKRVNDSGVPVDVVFEQGVEVLGLK